MVWAGFEEVVNIDADTVWAYLGYEENGIIFAVCSCGSGRGIEGFRVETGERRGAGKDCGISLSTLLVKRYELTRGGTGRMHRIWHRQS